MTIPLEYKDYHPETGQPEKVRFERICPRSSGIAKHQSGIIGNVEIVYRPSTDVGVTFDPSITNLSANTGASETPAAIAVS